MWQLLERSTDSIEHLLAVVPRALTLIGEAEALVHKASMLIDDIEVTRASAQGVVDRTSAVVDRADVLLTRSHPAMERITTLVDLLEPPLNQLQPALERLAETTKPHEVDALIHLIDHLPALADKMETEIMPVLDSLGSVAPDLHDLLDVSRELNNMLAQVPGIGRMKKRIDARQDADSHG